MKNDGKMMIKREFVTLMMQGRIRKVMQKDCKHNNGP